MPSKKSSVVLENSASKAQIVYSLASMVLVIGIYLAVIAAYNSTPLELGDVELTLLLGGTAFIAVAITFYLQAKKWIEKGTFPKWFDLYWILVRGLVLNAVLITIFSLGSLGLGALGVIAVAIFLSLVMPIMWILSEFFIRFLFVGKLKN